MGRSGDDVGRQVIFHDRDLVAQGQLALLQAGDLQMILRLDGRQGADRGIEIAMFDAQRRQPLAYLIFGHGLPFRRVVIAPRIAAVRVCRFRSIMI